MVQKYIWNKLINNVLRCPCGAGHNEDSWMGHNRFMIHRCTGAFINFIWRESFYLEILGLYETQFLHRGNSPKLIFRYFCKADLLTNFLSEVQSDHSHIKTTRLGRGQPPLSPHSVLKIERILKNSIRQTHQSYIGHQEYSHKNQWDFVYKLLKDLFVFYCVKCFLAVQQTTKDLRSTPLIIVDSFNHLPSTEWCRASFLETKL